jgi:hypothetical protein
MARQQDVDQQVLEQLIVKAVAEKRAGRAHA